MTLPLSPHVDERTAPAPSPVAFARLNSNRPSRSAVRCARSAPGAIHVRHSDLGGSEVRD